MVRVTEDNRDRLKSALGVAAFHALLGYALLTGLGFSPVQDVAQELRLFDVVEPPPPPPPAVPPPPRKKIEAKNPKPKDPEGAASPPNLKDTPTPVVAPKPEIPLPVPPPIVTAPVGGQGNAAKAGAAPVPGPGTGSGGVGNGLGSGEYGTGTGGGGGGGIGRPTRARHIRGSIGPSDYPDRAYRARTTGVVGLRFVVAPDGYVSDCAVTRSSGSRELDDTTCRLILRRFR